MKKKDAIMTGIKLGFSILTKQKIQIKDPKDKENYKNLIPDFIFRSHRFFYYFSYVSISGKVLP